MVKVPGAEPTSVQVTPMPCRIFRPPAPNCMYDCVEVIGPETLNPVGARSSGAEAVPASSDMALIVTLNGSPTSTSVSLSWAVI
jgi:hypothetical protein